MGLLSYLWKKFTPIEILDETTGELELSFFGPVYRVIYFTGFALAEKGKFYLTYSGMVKLLYTLFVALELWWLYVETTVDGLTECISVTSSQFITLYRYWTTIKNKEFYKTLARAMESPNFDISTPGRQQIVNNWRHKSEIYLKLVLILGSCTLSIWQLYPLLDDVEYNMVISLKLPFDYKKPRLYGVTYFLVSLVFSYTSYFVIINDLITQSHLIHLLCQYSVLQDCFENILDDCSEGFEDLDTTLLHSNEAFIQKYTSKLGALVKQHQFLLNNTMQIQKILSMPMLGQFSASAMLICCNAYQVTTMGLAAGVARFLMCLLFLVYSLIQLFILCQWCDEIKEQSERIREAVYFSGWERVAMVPGVRARLMLVIARASRPLVLTAGGLYDLSLTSYATLVKTSYSALTVLTQTQNN